MSITLKETFIQLCENYSTDFELIQKLWSEVELNYSHKGRYYHTLTHLENLLEQLKFVKHDITNWNSILFALYYHDFIYRSSKNDNEEKSAESSIKNLQLLNVPFEEIKMCSNIILATKNHSINSNNDINLFTDADLSILGTDWNVYEKYFTQVRKEYSIYPDLLYKPGRKKVLKHFLEMEHIFKTTNFRLMFEEKAKENMMKELAFLS